MKDYYIIKRNGYRVPFDRVKIEIAIRKAISSSKAECHSLPQRVSAEVEQKFIALSRNLNVEDIQDLVVASLVKHNKELAQVYANYRHERQVDRNASLHKAIDDLLTLKNKENENANKNSTLLSTQRDLMAGEISKNKAREEMIPRSLMKAHDEGIIHIHDMDYISQNMHNCSLVNLKDMLENGTKINNKLIETPKSLRTAATIMTQIVAGVASSQYGGQTISLAHISPYVEVSRKKIREEVKEEYLSSGIPLNDESIENIVRIRLSKEIKDSVQTIQYQLETLSTTNG